MSLRLIVALCLVSSGTLVQSRQGPPTSTGLILGQVVDGTSGQPLAGVTVALSGSIGLPAGTPIDVPSEPVPARPFTTRMVMTDGDGHFVFFALPAGRFSLSARKPGYLPGAYGQHAPSETFGISSRLDLGEAERRTDVTIPLWKFATIGGTVVDEAGEPVVGLSVRVLRRAYSGGRLRLGAVASAVTTDDRGVYRKAGLAPGDYVVAIPATQSTIPAAFEEAYRQAVSSGTITDLRRQWTANGADLGAATSGVAVGTLFMSPASQGDLSAASLANPPMAGSDRPPVYEAVFYPSVTSPSRATAITVGSGDERSDVDFHLRPVPTVRLSGTVTGPDGPAAFVGLTLTSAEIDDQVQTSGFEAATTTSDAAGAFTFLGVTPGQYVLRVTTTPVRPQSTSTMTTVIQTGTSTIMSGGGSSVPPPIPDVPTLWATLPVAVGEADVGGVGVALTPGVRLSGRLQFEGASPPPDADRIQRMSLMIDPVEGRSKLSSNSFMILRGQFDADGRLSTYQIPGGRYLVRPGSFPGWTFKSAMWKGQDVSVTPLDLAGSETPDITIVFTDTPTRLAGTVRDADGAGAAEALVVTFPTDPRMWVDFGATSRRLRSTASSESGAYALTGLPAGDYYVAALPPDQAEDWQTPTFLQQLVGSAVRVTLGDAEKKTQDLKTSRIK
jgi:Carboxypeptidase regulatory-like domain